MKNSLLIFILFTISITGYGQFGAQQIISISGDDPYQVISADIDGDNDMDVIVSTVQDTKLVWYENTDGLGNFDAGTLITSNFSSAGDINVADIDGDNDLDIVAVFGVSRLLIWFENTDGMGNFDVGQTIF